MMGIGAYIFTATTISYRSSLFPGRSVSVRSGRIVTTLIRYSK